VVADDLLAEDVLTDPYPTLAALREAEPVHWSERYRAWLVCGYDECSAAHTDARISSDRIEPVLRKLQGEGGSERLVSTLQVLAGWMVFKDGAEHRRLRQLMQRSFTPRSVELLGERVAAITGALLDDVTAADEADLVDRLAAPLPSAVIAEMLGAPTADTDRFRAWSEDIVALVFGAMGDDDRHERAIEGMAELVDYLDALVAAKREQPADDLLSLTLRPGPDGDVLFHDEIIAMSTLLLFGGSETTTNLIGSGLLALMRNPDQAARLREDPELVAPAVEELLRYDGPARISARVVGEALELGGRTLRAGERVFLVLAAANRDPARFVRPDELDLGRTPNQHLGFGLGRHYCLGASLARLEGRTVIPMALERLEGHVLATEDLRYAPTLLSRSLRSLPVRRRECTSAAGAG